MSDPFGIEKGMKVRNFLSLRKVARGKTEKPVPFRDTAYANAKYQKRMYGNRDPELNRVMDAATRTSPAKRAQNRKGIF